MLTFSANKPDNMTRCIAVMMLLINTFSLSATNNARTSTNIDRSSTHSNTLATYLQLSESFLNRNLDSSFFWIKKALQIREHGVWPETLSTTAHKVMIKLEEAEHGFEWLEIAELILKEKEFITNKAIVYDTYFYAGTGNLFSGNFAKSRKVFKQGLRSLDSLNDTAYDRLRVNIMEKMGVWYGMQNDIVNALNWFIRADSLVEELEDPALGVLVSMDIGSMLMWIESYPDALERFAIAEEYNKNSHIGDENAIVDNMATCYKEMKNYDKAREYINRGRTIALAANNTYSLAFSYMNEAHIDYDEKKIASSILKFNKADSLFSIIGDTFSIMMCKSAWLWPAIEAGEDYQKIMRVSEEILHYSANMKETNEYLWALKARAKLYFLLGNYQHAYIDLDSFENINYRQLKESYSIKQAVQSTLLKTTLLKRQIEEQRQLAELIKEKAERKNIIIYITSTCGIILLIALLLYYRLATRLHESREMIAEQNRVLEKKDLKNADLMKELHHRVKNNLQIVSSLLNLQSSKVSDQLAKSAFTEGRNRVDAMAMIHRYLYMNDELTSVDIRPYLERLSESVAYSYGFHKGQLRLDYELDSVSLDVDIAIPLGLIANELLSNAFKYAYIKNPNPQLSMRLKVADTIQFSISDNGPGMDKHLLEGKSNSFGMELIQSLTNQLHGSIHYENKAGSTFTLYIPIDPLKNKTTE
ncbi:hypothetical protein GC194_02690 [bacterium]|nr:hypothetical protein [bacterium]